MSTLTGVQMCGLSSGGGPAHLLLPVDGGYRTACGVKRFDVVQFSAFALMRRGGPCGKCVQRVEPDTREPAERRADGQRLRARIAALNAALTDLQAARAKVDALLAESRNVDDPRIKACFEVAHRNGYTLERIGELVGLTKGQVRQRIEAKR